MGRVAFICNKLERKMAVYKIVMLRHGESEWNKENKFCGWYDANLSETGVSEAIAGGKALKEAGYTWDLAHTSLLTRAQVTLKNVLEQIGQSDIPVEKTWRLNERHYGGLTGLNKAETAAKHGEEQVKIWRRSFDTPPPAMDLIHPYYNIIVNDPRYKDGPSRDEFPMFESLKLTIDRTLPYCNDAIMALNLPTGIPFVYELDENMKPVKPMQFLG